MYRSSFVLVRRLTHLVVYERSPYKTLQKVVLIHEKQASKPASQQLTATAIHRLITQKPPQQSPRCIHPPSLALLCSLCLPLSPPFLQQSLLRRRALLLPAVLSACSRLTRCTCRSPTTFWPKRTVPPCTHFPAQAVALRSSRQPHRPPRLPRLSPFQLVLSWRPSPQVVPPPQQSARLCKYLKPFHPCFLLTGHQYTRPGDPHHDCYQVDYPWRQLSPRCQRQARPRHH